MILLLFLDLMRIKIVAFQIAQSLGHVVDYHRQPKCTSPYLTICFSYSSISALKVGILPTYSSCKASYNAMYCSPVPLNEISLHKKDILSVGRGKDFVLRRFLSRDQGRKCPPSSVLSWPPAEGLSFGLLLRTFTAKVLPPAESEKSFFIDFFKIFKDTLII